MRARKAERLAEKLGVLVVERNRWLRGLAVSPAVTYSARALRYERDLLIEAAVELRRLSKPKKRKAP